MRSTPLRAKTAATLATVNRARPSKAAKEVLGMWVAQTEGAKFWLGVVTELRNRGVEDIFIACVDGLKGLPDAIETVFAKTEVQLCIVHLVRQSLNYVGWKQRKEVAADMKLIYSSATREEAELGLEEFSSKWDGKYPTISPAWRRNWERIEPFLAYPGEIRRVIYQKWNRPIKEWRAALNRFAIVFEGRLPIV
jgi:putative transposase